MEWIKSHLTVAIVGAVSFLSLVAIILGLFLCDVTAALAKDARLFTRLRLDPVNEGVIDQARQDHKGISDNLDDFLEAYRKIGARRPLYPPAFSKTDGVNKDAAFDFQDKYKKRQTDLLEEVLKAKGAPTEEGFRGYMEHERRQMEDERDNSRLGLDHKGKRPTGPVDVRPGPLGKFAGKPGAEQRDSEADRIRFNVLWAHDAYCYAGPDSLDPRPTITDSNAPPSQEDMWYAQVALWVQEDVVGALADMNGRAAEALPETDRWVANLPVKHLIRFRLGNYIASEAGEEMAVGGRKRKKGRDTDLVLSDIGSAFTRRGSGNNVDVIRFHTVLVVEAQRLLEVMAAISKAGFYTPLQVSYQAQPTTPLDTYVYGSVPTIEVTLVYEGCFLRSTYEQWMPEIVRTAVAEGRAGGMSGGGSAGKSRPPRPPPRAPSWPSPGLGGREFPGGS